LEEFVCQPKKVEGADLETIAISHEQTEAA
jgi:hypothetical protein